MSALARTPGRVGAFARNGRDRETHRSDRTEWPRYDDRATHGDGVGRRVQPVGARPRLASIPRGNWAAVSHKSEPPRRGANLRCGASLLEAANQPFVIDATVRSTDPGTVSSGQGVFIRTAASATPTSQGSKHKRRRATPSCSATRLRASFRPGGGGASPSLARRCGRAHSRSRVRFRLIIAGRGDAGLLSTTRRLTKHVRDGNNVCQKRWTWSTAGSVPAASPNTCLTSETARSRVPDDTRSSRVRRHGALAVQDGRRRQCEPR